MMERLAQASEGSGCTPTPFHYIYHHKQQYTLQLRGQIHPPYFISTPMYSVVPRLEVSIDITNSLKPLLPGGGGGYRE